MQLDLPALALLVMPDLNVVPHMYESTITDHRARLAVAGAVGPWVSIGLDGGRAVWFGGGPGESNLRIMTMQSALGLAVTAVNGPAIIAGLTPDTIIQVMASVRGTLIEVK